MGYYISTFSFKGPFLSSQVIQNGTAALEQNLNLYCVKKDLLGPDAASEPAALLAAAQAKGTGKATGPGNFRVIGIPRG